MRHILFAAAVAAALLPGLASAQQQANAVTWGFASEVETLDPYATSKRTSQLVIRNVLENLAVRDPATGQAKPALATAWRHDAASGTAPRRELP
jgi:peptide/nickel transport system substrate-binding protein